MKKLMTILAASVLMAIAPLSLAQTNNVYTKLTVGLDENFPPMGFRDDKGELVGFDIDMAKEASKRLKVETKFQAINWSSKELELNSKKIDLLWNGVTITPDRQKQMLFSKPYMKNRQIIVIKNDSQIKSKADLAGKLVGVQKESSAIDAIKKDETTLKSLKEVQEYADNISAFTDLKIGRIAAVVVDEIAAKYFITTSKEPFKVLEDHFGEELYGVAMRLDDQELLSHLQKTLDEMSKDGSAAKISKKWFGEDLVIHQ